MAPPESLPVRQRCRLPCRRSLRCWHERGKGGAGGGGGA
jgi:hypothetical protein